MYACSLLDWAMADEQEEEERKSLPLLGGLHGASHRTSYLIFTCKWRGTEKIIIQGGTAGEIQGPGTPTVCMSHPHSKDSHEMLRRWEHRKCPSSTHKATIIGDTEAAVAFFQGQ